VCPRKVGVRGFDCGIWGGIGVRVGEGSIAICESQSMSMPTRGQGLPGLRGSGKPVCLLRTFTSLAGKSWTLVGMIVWKVEDLRKWVR
jgi:hypothetical protein